MARLRDLRCVYPTPWRSPQTVGFKTKAWYDEHGFSVRLYGTNVCSFDALNNTVTVTAGGWHTKITAERINYALSELNLRLLTNDLPGRWRVADYNGNAWTIRGNILTLRRRRDGTWVRSE